MTLLESPNPPPFIYLHHPHQPPVYANPAVTSRCVTTQLDTIGHHVCYFAQLDAIEHHTPRLLWSGALWKISEAFGVDSIGEVSTWDGFSRGLRDLWEKLQEKKINPRSTGTQGGKGKGKEREETVNGKGHTVFTGNTELVVLVITKAERLRGILGLGWAMMTRLAELVSRDSSYFAALAANRKSKLMLHRLVYLRVWCWLLKCLGTRYDLLGGMQ